MLRTPSAAYGRPTRATSLLCTNRVLEQRRQKAPPHTHAKVTKTTLKNVCVCVLPTEQCCPNESNSKIGRPGCSFLHRCSFCCGRPNKRPTSKFIVYDALHKSPIFEKTDYCNFLRKQNKNVWRECFPARNCFPQKFHRSLQKLLKSGASTSDIHFAKSSLANCMNETPFCTCMQTSHLKLQCTLCASTISRFESKTRCRLRVSPNHYCIVSWDFGAVGIGIQLAVPQCADARTCAGCSLLVPILFVKGCAWLGRRCLRHR